jgi:hypothetical protein
MPYVTRQVRDELDDKINYAGRTIASAGELNYLITNLVQEFITEQGKSYDTINSAIGALECAKLELYRRIVAPYEELKIQQNGDVYNI